MQYLQLGRTGVWVSEICLGGLTFGNEVDLGGTERIVSRFLEAGGNFIDTADIYNGGMSEEYLGKVLRGNRDGTVLATKGGFPSGSDPNASGNSRRYLIRSVEGSLRRLQTDWIDLYQVHYWDPWTPLDETLAALSTLITQGKVRYVGASNFSGSQLGYATGLAEGGGGPRFESCQLEYSLLIRDAERELLPLCRDREIGALSWGALAGGILTGKYASGSLPQGTRLGDPTDWPATTTGRLTSTNKAIVNALLDVAAATGHNPSQVALNWTRSVFKNLIPVVGVRRPEQLEDNLGAVGWTLDDDAVKRLCTLNEPAAGFPFEGQAVVHGMMEQSRLSHSA